MRATDTLARIGGNNFAIVLEDLTHSEHAERVKRNVEDALGVPVLMGGRELAAQADIRLRFYPGSETDDPLHYHSWRCALQQGDIVSCIRKVLLGGISPL